MRTSLPSAVNPDELAKVEQLLEHFEQLEAQFEHVRESLTHSHRLSTLGTIATIIAHEFNNILTPIISYSQLALAEPENLPSMRLAIEKSLAGAERAAQISGSLLGFAREADEQHVARLKSVVGDTIACLARDPRKDGIELNIRLPDLLVAISPLNLQQVLLNLVLNARQAMIRDGGRLDITADLQGAMAHIQVGDTGPGIPQKIIERLFQPFVSHRTGPTRDPNEPKGTGLGLCICRDLVRAAGGAITVTSTPGNGATFHIKLPIAHDLFETT